MREGKGDLIRDKPGNLVFGAGTPPCQVSLCGALARLLISERSVNDVLIRKVVAYVNQVYRRRIPTDVQLKRARRTIQECHGAANEGRSRRVFSQYYLEI